MIFRQKFILMNQFLFFECKAICILVYPYINIKLVAVDIAQLKIESLCYDTIRYSIQSIDSSGFNEMQNKYITCESSTGLMAYYHGFPRL